MGKVAWGFTSSIDGFIAGPGHDMSWFDAVEPLPAGLTERMAAAVGVIISGRKGYDAAKAQQSVRDDSTAEAYGGAWSGTEFILTHHPEELAGDSSVTALDCSIAEAIDRAQGIAGEKDIQIISADIASQALEHGLIDELQVFVAPVLLGDGIRIFDFPGGRRYDWELTGIIEGAERSFGRTYRPKLS